MRRAQEYEQRILCYLEAVNKTQQTNSFKELQLWQANRLLNTHIDLYNQDRFKPAMDFFKDELYSAEHFHRRNKQIIRALPLMCSTLPETVIEIVANAAELHSLSLELDTLLLHRLPNTKSKESITLTDWVQAYKECNNPNERERQIILIERLGNELKKVVKKPMIKSLLTWAKYPAILAGYQDIHQFVCSGFNAFEHLDSPDEFLIPVIQKERELSEKWFRGEVTS